MKTEDFSSPASGDKRKKALPVRDAYSYFAEVRRGDALLSPEV